LASSLRTGFGALPQSSPGALVCLADTPFFKAETLRDVVPVDNLNLIVLPRYQRRHGHPKYFPRWLFSELLKLRGDQGARAVLNRFQEKTRIVEVDDPGILKDFDTPEDFS
jgi:molybdenum cofactor cytidylyltransferase